MRRECEGLLNVLFLDIDNVEEQRRMDRNVKKELDERLRVERERIRGAAFGGKKRRADDVEVDGVG